MPEGAFGDEREGHMKRQVKIEADTPLDTGRRRERYRLGDVIERTQLIIFAPHAPSQRLSGVVGTRELVECRQLQSKVSFGCVRAMRRANSTVPVL